jgi:hypothetical protein
MRLGRIAISTVEGKYCDYCDTLVAKITLKQNANNDSICRDCYKIICKNCNCNIDEGDFCSYYCKQEHKLSE